MCVRVFFPATRPTRAERRLDTCHPGTSQQDIRPLPPARYLKVGREAIVAPPVISPEIMRVVNVCGCDREEWWRMKPVAAGCWRKSTFSYNTDCVETRGEGMDILVRDSKNELGQILSIPRAAWTVFVSSLRR